MAAQKFQFGDRAYVNAKHTQYDAKNYGVHEGMEVITRGNAYNGYYNVTLPNGQQISMASTALDKIPSRTKKEQFEEQIEKAQAKIAATQEFINETRMKIQFMDEIKTEDFDENEFKAYQTLTLIENTSMSKLEKAKAIASLINKK
jgi:hypothetical protein